MLLDLLPELFQHIISYCTVKDLGNLACTCSECNTILRKTLYHTVRVPRSVLRQKNISDVRRLNEKLKTLQDTQVLRLFGPGIAQCCFKTISTLPSLIEINLSYSTDTDDLDIGILCEGLHHVLKVLNVSHTKITDRGLIFVQKLCALEELYLTNCAISDAGVSHLHTLRRLTALCLSNAHLIGDGGMSRLSTLLSLRQLDVSFCGKITDLGVFRIGNLSKLMELNVSFTAVSDRGVERLCELKGLRTLDVSYCQKVSDVAVEHLCRGLGACLQRLNVDGCSNVSDDGKQCAYRTFSYLGKQKICECGDPTKNGRLVRKQGNIHHTP